MITDVHADHLSTTTIASVIGADTILIVPKAVSDVLPPELASRARVLNNDEGTTIKGLEVMAFPMYNLSDSADNKYPRGRGNAYMLNRDGFNIYIAGDTSDTPEMRELKNIDIAFIPMNPPFTMSVDEAVDAVLAFKPKQVYPFHYRGANGLEDINRFKNLVEQADKSIDIVMLNWYK